MRAVTELRMTSVSAAAATVAAATVSSAIVAVATTTAKVAEGGIDGKHKEKDKKNDALDIHVKRRNYPKSVIGPTMGL